jgi:hypothetical protein
MASDAPAPQKPDPGRETEALDAEGWKEAVLRKARHALLSLRKFTR